MKFSLSYLQIVTIYQHGQWTIIGIQMIFMHPCSTKLF